MLTADTSEKPDTDSPQTGDNSNAMLWAALLFVSGGGLAALAATKRRRKHTVK